MGCCYIHQGAPRVTAEKRRLREQRLELDELNDEYSLLRKLKKGKISEVMLRQSN